MDLTKKRKADENGGAYPVSNEPDTTAAAPPVVGILTPEDIDKILETFTKEQCVSILRDASLRYSDVLEGIRSVADADISQRKLFVRGLGWETTTDKLRQVFSAYGELDEAIVITDKASAKSKGYGFVTFKHVDAAILSLKEPNKKIDGRITVTQLAAAGNSGNSQSVDVALRKIYVGNVPFEISSEKLLNNFSIYGEIEEGPLGFDKQTGKAKGFAFFVYKTEEGARASLADPVKTIEGHQVLCKLATDNKKGKQQNMGPGMPNAGPTGMPGDDRVGSMPGSNYGVPVSGLGPYQGFSGGPGPGMQQPPPQPGMVAHHNPHMNSAVGGPGYGNQGPGSYAGGSGGYSGTGGYGGVGGGSGDYSGGLGNPGYRMPQSSAGMPSSGGYPDGGNYGLQSAYPSQVPQPGSGSRVPPGGMYQGMPPYY